MRNTAPGFRSLSRLFCAAAAAVGFFALLSGCSSFEHHQYVFWGDIVPQHPETLEDYWTDYGPFLPDDHTKKMRRGKAGVLRFYKKGDFERSIPVDGELVVYVFEGHDDGIELTSPKYKLVVDSQRLNRQRKFDKKNGYSYHIWLDLGEVDQPEESISILVVFTETKTRDQVASGITYTQIGGEPTHETKLKGSRKGDLLKQELDEKSNDPARQTAASDKGAVAEISDTDRGKEGSNEVFSIDLSNSLAEQIASAPAPVIDESPSRPPIKTALITPEPAPAEEPLLSSKKLTFEQLRTVGDPLSAAGGTLTQGTAGGTLMPQTAQSQTSAAEPNPSDGK